MNAGRPELTARHLALPTRFAAKFAREGTYLFDDIESACMVSVAKAWKTYDAARGGSFETHLFNCCQRVAWYVVNRSKKPSFRVPGGPPVPLGDTEWYDDHWEAIVASSVDAPDKRLEDQDDFEDMVSRLVGRERKVVRMVYGDGLSYDECAKRLGVTASYVRMIRDAAVRRLRGEMGVENGKT